MRFTSMTVRPARGISRTSNTHQWNPDTAPSPVHRSVTSAKAETITIVPSHGTTNPRTALPRPCTHDFP